MTNDLEALRAEVKQLREEIAELKTRTVITHDDNRTRESFTRQAILDLAQCVLLLGKTNLPSEDYAKIKKLAGV